jgi:hypothetical protein
MSLWRKASCIVTLLLLVLSHDILLRGQGPSPLRTTYSPSQRRVHLMTLFALATSEPSQLPLYMNYYAESCGRNAYFDCTIFILVPDALYAEYALWPAPRFFACRPLDDALHANVRLRLINDSDWVTRAKAQTGLETIYGTESMFKLADYKPLLGHIFGPYSPALSSKVMSPADFSWKGTQDEWDARFENFLMSDVYSHWGFADPDVIFGDLSRFFLPSHDAWTSYFRGGWTEMTTAGQLLILRNTLEFRELWHDAESMETSGKWVESELINPRRVTYSELLFGRQLFAFTELHNKSFHHKLVSFSDERGSKIAGVSGRFFDVWWEDGRVFGRRACNKQSRRPYPPNQEVSFQVEGAIFHVWVMKKWLSDVKNTWQNRNMTMFTCNGWDFPTPTPWHLNRWNYSFVMQDGGATFIKASFHDPNWSAESDYPTGSCTKENVKARLWGT